MNPTKYILVIIASIVSCISAQAITIIGNPIFNPANGHTYSLLSPGTWTDSEAFALTLGGHLATVNDAAENQWLFTTFPPLTGDSVPALVSLWIGFNDAATEGTFVWSSGEPVTFTFWFPGQPDNIGNEDYATIRPGPAAPPAGSWNDLNNLGGGAEGHAYGVVEVVPEPGAFALMGLCSFGLAALHKSRQKP